MATGQESGQPPFLYNDFSGGLNTYDSYNLLTDNECRDCQNVQGTTAGAIVKRPGWVTLATPGLQPTSVFAPTQSSQLLIYATPTFLVSYNAGVIGSLVSGLSSGNWQFVRGPVVGGQGPTFGMNGADNPTWWNESATVGVWSATDAGGSLPNGKYCLLHQNQVFVTGVGTNPARVFWSGLADPTAWNPANVNGSGWEDFDPNDGQTITGIGTVGPYLLVFKQHKSWVLVNPATAQVRQLSDSIGCAGHRTIAEGLEGTYFLTGDSQVAVTNGTHLSVISDKIAPTLQSGTWTAACYHNRHYYLSGTILGSPVTLDYDARLQSWWKHTIAANDWTLANDPTYGWVPVAAQSSSSFLSLAFQDETNWQDNGSDFTWKWVGPWQSPTFYRRRRFPTTYFRKRIRQIRFDGVGTVDVSMAKDFTPIETLVSSDIFGAAASSDTFAGGGLYADDDGSVFGGGPTNTPARVYGQGVARAWSMVFSATSSTQDMLTSYTYVVGDRKDSLVG